MRRLHVEAATPVVLDWNHTLAIYTLGYEQRSIYAAQHTRGHAMRRVVFGFMDCRMFAYQDNKDWYVSNGFDVRECLDTEFRGQLESLLADFFIDDSDQPRILIDISSLNRLRLAILIDVLRNTQLRTGVRVDFVYSLAEYSPPPNLTLVNRHVGPMTSEFSGWWTEPDLPTVAIVGVGYEEDKALGAIEHVQPSEVWLLFPRSPIPEYTSALDRANASLLENVKSERVLNYDVDQPYALFANLESLVAGLSSRANCILLPFGPKLFALSSLLVACVHPDAAVWRVSGAEQPNNRIGHSIHALSVVFPRDTNLMVDTLT